MTGRTTPERAMILVLLDQLDAAAGPAARWEIMSSAIDEAGGTWTPPPEAGPPGSYFVDIHLLGVHASGRDAPAAVAAWMGAARDKTNG